MEVARIVTGDLSDHLNFDVNDDIEEHVKTAHDKVIYSIATPSIDSIILMEIDVEYNNITSIIGQ